MEKSLKLGSSEKVETHSSEPTQKARVAWMDIAKGGSIFLVVLYHVCMFMLNSGFEVETLIKFNASVGPIRMPLFFLVSGVFSASLIKREWNVILTGRFWNLTYLFLLWSLFFWLFQVFFLSALSEHAPLDFSRLLMVWADPFSSLWFLWALALYTLITKASQGYRILCASIAVVMFYLSFNFEDQLSFSQSSCLRYILFFQIGVWFRNDIIAFFEKHLWSCAVLGLIYFPVGAAFVHMDFGSPSYVALRLVMSLTGLCLALVLCRAIELSNLLSAPFIWLGQRTLPIYVLHSMLAWMIILPLSTVSTFRETLPAHVLAVTISVLLVVLCVGLHAVLNRAGLHRLFAAPTRLASGRVVRKA